MEPAGLDRKADRTTYFDYLRILATFAVIVLHVSASNWSFVDVNSAAWKTFNFYNGISRWCVPVFVMISGALFLNRDVPLKKICSKYIFRLAVSFVVWSAVYSLFLRDTAANRILSAVQGYYHMWFIPMIIGVYLLIPLIRPVVRSGNRTRYYLLLSFVFAFAAPEVVTLTEDFGGPLVRKAVGAVNVDFAYMNMHMVMGYVSYFVLGYYLDRITLGRKQRIAVYALGLLGFVSTVGLNLTAALRTQTLSQRYYGNFTVNVLLEAAAVFTWFKYGRYDHERMNRLVQRLSGYSFGAYLVHVLIIEQMSVRLGFQTLSFSPVFSIPCIGLIVFVLSFGISALLNRIPVVKKYMV